MTTKAKGRSGGDRPTPKTSDDSNAIGSAALAGGLGAARAKLKAMIVRFAVLGLIPSGVATWLIQRGGLRHA